MSFIKENYPEVEKRTVQLSGVRVNWVDVFEPRVPKGSETGAARFGITSILDPKANKKEISQINKIIKQLATQVLEIEVDEIERSKMPLKKPRKAEVEKQPAYKGKYILPAYSPSDSPVQVVDRSMNLLAKGSPIPYSGCVCNVAVEFYVTAKRQDSVFCSLVAVQFVEDGEPLGGGAKQKADDLFKKIDDEEDDFDEEEDDDDDDDDDDI